MTDHTALHDIETRIAQTCADSNRPRADVTLIAVSKTRTADEIETLVGQGIRDFGENRIQEVSAKFPALKQKYPDIRLHFIGQLQSNKAKEAVSLCDVIHSVDRLSLAEALATEMKKQNRHLPCLIQVNTGDEEQKGGVAPHELAALYQSCIALGLDIRGLTVIPPVDDIPDLHFALLHKLAQELKLPWLSMGMSSDFEAAIRWKATHIRIGTALFGERTSLDNE